MSDQPSGSMPPAPSEPRPPARGGAGWIGGIVLIVLGVVFMLQSSGIFVGNWWTVFIYIPAAISLFNVFRTWRRDGRFTQSATGSLVGGLLLTTVATILLLNLDFSRWWPAILIAIGLGLVVGNSLISRR